MTYQYQNVWKKLTPELITEITEFWANEKALPKDAQPTKRAEQVVVIMRDENNKLAAVSKKKKKENLLQKLYLVYVKHFITTVLFALKNIA